MADVRSQYRFFLDPDRFSNDKVFFPENVAHQLTRVLRLRTGAQVVALDGSGKEFHVLLDIQAKAVQGSVVRIELNEAEPQCRIHLFQAIPKAKKLETVLRQCTEIGVGEFTPIATERTNRDAETTEQRHRYAAVVREAAEQCGRGLLPTVHAMTKLEEVFSGDVSGVFFSNEDNPIPSNASDPKPVARDFLRHVNVFIGPEGGFSPSERDGARTRGLQIRSMGPRTFRVDTAAAVACAMILRENGDI